MSSESVEAPPIAQTYVYGVVAREAALELPVAGVADAPVRTLPEGGVAALVSPLPAERFRVRRRDLTNHLRVLEEVFAAATVVPCAFGMVVPSEQSVREFLQPRQAELRALLERLDGHVQLNVRASYDEDVVLREIVANDPSIAQLRERTRTQGNAGYFDRIRLGELIAAELARLRERDADELLQRLSEHAADIAVDEPSDGPVLKASFLVARDRLEAFDAELEQVANTHAPRLRIDSLGPLPPTAFAALEGAGWGS